MVRDQEVTLGRVRVPAYPSFGEGPVCQAVD
jgi:hypothetical protein